MPKKIDYWKTSIRHKAEAPISAKCREGNILDYSLRTEHSVLFGDIWACSWKWADRPLLTEQQQQPANTYDTSSAPAEWERAGAKFSLSADCPHESHFTLPLNYYVCCRLLRLYKAERGSFFGSFCLWLSLLPTHTQISWVAVTETGISKELLHLPMAPFSR